MDQKYDMVDEDFKYLIRMPLDAQTLEEADKIMKQHDEKCQLLEKLKTTSIESMWLSELETLQKEYLAYYKQDKVTTSSSEKKPKKKLVIKN